MRCDGCPPSSSPPDRRRSRRRRRSAACLSARYARSLEPIAGLQAPVGGFYMRETRGVSVLGDPSDMVRRFSFWFPCKTPPPRKSTLNQRRAQRTSCLLVDFEGNPSPNKENRMCVSCSVDVAGVSFGFNIIMRGSSLSSQPKEQRLSNMWHYSGPHGGTYNFAVSKWAIVCDYLVPWSLGTKRVVQSLCLPHLC